MGGKSRNKNKKAKRASRQRRRNFQRSLSNENDQARKKQKELRMTEKKAAKRQAILLEESRQQQEALQKAKYHHAEYIRYILKVHTTNWPLLKRVNKIMDMELKAIEKRNKRKEANPDTESTSDEEGFEEILEWILGAKKKPKKDDEDPDAGFGIAAKA